MTRTEFVERILSMVNSVSVTAKVKGFYEAKIWATGINPCGGDSVISGEIVSSPLESLVGQSYTQYKHWSYNGTFRDKYLGKKVERPNYDRSDARYSYEYEEGTYIVEIEVSLDELPKVKASLTAYLMEQIRVAVDTRPLPGVKLCFYNHGYSRHEYSEYPYAHSDVDIQHYNADWEALVVFGRSFKKDLSNHKKVSLHIPSGFKGVTINWQG